MVFFTKHNKLFSQQLEKDTFKMKTSETFKEIFTALIAAQGEFTPALKDTNNAFFKSKYATLDNVVEVIRPVLKKYKLAFLQTTETLDGQLVLKTMLIHESAEWIFFHYPLNPIKNDPQGLGSALTYAKRYSLCSLLGIVADEDDDGNSASGKPALPPNNSNPNSGNNSTGRPPALPPSGSKSIDIKKEIQDQPPIVIQPTIVLKDEPVEPPKPTAPVVPNEALGVYVMKSGRGYQGNPLSKFIKKDLQVYVQDCLKLVTIDKNVKLPVNVIEDIKNIKAYLGIE